MKTIPPKNPPARLQIRKEQAIAKDLFRQRTVVDILEITRILHWLHLLMLIIILILVTIFIIVLTFFNTPQHENNFDFHPDSHGRTYHMVFGNQTRQAFKL